MMKLLMISVTQHMPQNRVSDTITHVAPNTIMVQCEQALISKPSKYLVRESLRLRHMVKQFPPTTSFHTLKTYITYTLPLSFQFLGFRALEERMWVPPCLSKSQKCQQTVPSISSRCVLSYPIPLESIQFMLRNPLSFLLCLPLRIRYRECTPLFMYTQGRFTPWTVKSNHGIWPFPWSDFLRNLFTPPLGPSLAVNSIWTKRNDHAPKNDCAGFSNICPPQMWF